MAAILPSALFPGYEYVAAAGTVTADSIVIPLAALPGLTAAEADDTTGDGREVARSLDVAMFEGFTGLSEVARPAHMTVTATSSTTGTTRNRTYTKSYTLEIDDAQLNLLPE